MLLKINWIWLAYSWLYAALLSLKVQNIFFSKSPQFIYFHLLMGFDVRFYLVYFLAAMQVLVNIVHILPVIGLAFRIRIFPAEVWQWLLLLKITFDLSGHSYELNQIISLYHDSPEFALRFLCFILIPFLPSYCSSYIYAFKQEEVLAN